MGGEIVMGRRFVLAMMLLGALFATAYAQSQSVVTLPLKPPQAKSEGKAAKPTPKPSAEKIAAAPTQPAEALSPQAVIAIPPPAFATEPLFPGGLTLEPEALPTPAIERTLIEAQEKPPAKPPTPLPQPKPAAPAVAEQPAPSPKAETIPKAETRPLRRGEMEPIDDYRPAAPPSVVVNAKALDASLSPAVTEKPAAEMPAAKIPLPQSKPPLPTTSKAKAKPAPGEMMPIDDIPGGKSYKAPLGQAATFRCFVRDVMAFYDRTHIRCYNKARNKLNFFAVDTGQPISAAVVSKGLAAMQAGKPATVTFAPDADLNPSNCAAANCRRLIDIQN